MKIGVRTPSIKRSIKARTTGRLKRSAKSALNPLYGKKGMGYINNPKKAIYNNIYRKTTVSSIELLMPKSSKKTNSVLCDEMNIEKNYVFLDSGICGPLMAVSMIPIFLFWLIGGFVQLFSPGIGGLLKGIAYLLIIGDVACFGRMVYVEYVNRKNLYELNLKIDRQLSKEDAKQLEYEMQGYFGLIIEHLDKLTNSKEYTDFVYEYTFVSTILEEAIKIEKAFIFESGDPSELLENLELKKPLLIKDLIDTHYEVAKEKILSLKTENAKFNNANKFFEKFEVYFSEMPEECASHVKYLYNKLKDMIKS